MHSVNPNRYEGMKYRRCGASGLLLPELSLGLWHNFGGVDSPDSYRPIVWAAFDAGITHFDLANNYGPPPGSAESNLGRILAHDLRAYRHELIIATKAGYDMWPGPYGQWGSRKHLLASLDASLKRLGLEYVDIFYSHRHDPNTPLEETMGALAHAVRQGKALYVGISNYPLEATHHAAGLLRNLGAHCLVHQAKYSMLERGVERGLLSTFARCRMGCIAFSPLAQGLLTDRYIHGIPGGSRASKPHGFLQPQQVTPEVLSRVQQLNQVAEERGQTLAQMAIAWLLRDSRITSVLIGASSVEQLSDNLKSLNAQPFTPKELHRIKEILGKVSPSRTISS